MRGFVDKKWVCSALVVASGVLTLKSAVAQTPTTGSVRGTVIESRVNSAGIDIALDNANQVRVELIAANGSTVDTVSSNGAYAFPTVQPGSYLVRGYSRNGRYEQVKVWVEAGLSTPVNFALIARRGSGIVPYYPAVATYYGVTSNPDVDLDGMVGKSDLDIVQRNQGLTGRGAQGDVNLDGVVNQTDTRAVKASFGRAAMLLPSHYQAQVTPAGSVADIGSGMTTVSTQSGTSTGIVDWYSSDHTKVRFTITEDRGTASSPAFGNFQFTENPANLTVVDVDLETGRVLGGNLGLLVSGGTLGGTFPVSATIPNGLIAFNQSGFSLYHVVSVSGLLDKGFPVFPETPFLMVKDEEKKPDVPCASSTASASDRGLLNDLVTTVSCNLPASTKCSSAGTACAKGGSCGKCKTWAAASPGGYNSCWCMCSQ